MDKTLTFTSDFGLADPYVGEVKGVVGACSAGVRIVDITHELEQGALTAASFVLSGACRYFARGTLHLAVIDPGVGTERGVLVIRTKNYAFVGPDNGILFEAANRDGIEELYLLDVRRFTKRIAAVFHNVLPVRRILEQGVSGTFHGRDIFAPLAALVLEGMDLDEVAVRVEDCVRTTLPSPKKSEGSVQGEIVYVDRFGNLVTNINEEIVAPGDGIAVLVENEWVNIPLVETYARVPPGSVLALIGSHGMLEISVNGGSAARELDAGYATKVLILKGEKTGER